MTGKKHAVSIIRDAASYTLNEAAELYAGDNADQAMIKAAYEILRDAAKTGELRIKRNAYEEYNTPARNTREYYYDRYFKKYPFGGYDFHTDDSTEIRAHADYEKEQHRRDVEMFIKMGILDKEAVNRTEHYKIMRDALIKITKWEQFAIDVEIYSDNYNDDEAFRQEMIEAIKDAKFCWPETEVTAGDITEYCKKSGIIHERFNPEPATPEEPENNRFDLDLKNIPLSVKMNAAIKVLKALDTDIEYHKKKSPTQRISQWLKDHYKDLGLIKPDGSMNKEGIEQISKVANWNPSGGTPKVE